MARFHRIGSWSIIAVAVAFGALGLWNQHRGAPAGSVAGLSTLPKTLFDDARARFSQLPLPGLKEHGSPSDNSLHAIQESIGCGLPDDDGIDPGIERTAWSWRDENGVANFADTPPEGTTAQVRALRAGHAEYFITLDAMDAVLPAYFEGSLNAAAKRIYDQWRDWLGNDALVRSHINLRFFGDRDVFLELWGKPGEGNRSPLGFYRIRDNEAVILTLPGRPRTTLSTAFHEMSHLITAWHLGPSAPWLNEGIAEYFENMDVRWQESRFSRNDAHLRLLRHQGPLPLEELTRIGSRDWTADDAQRRYASAWALVAFLQETTRGRELLREVLLQTHAQRCAVPVDPAPLLASYKGGIASLEADLRTWINSSSSATP